MPFWQTTVVPELGGTTTVVFFAGGGGLLLLMQPVSSDAAMIALARISFIIDSSYQLNSVEELIVYEQDCRRQRPMARATVAGSPTICRASPTLWGGLADAC